jgi:hypothetical protein
MRIDEKMNIANKYSKSNNGRLKEINYLYIRVHISIQ